MVSVLSLTACVEQNVVSENTVGSDLGAIKAACEQEIMRELVDTENKQITTEFDQFDGVIQARVVILDPSDGISVYLNYNCEQDSAGNVTARLLAG